MLASKGQKAVGAGDDSGEFVLGKPSDAGETILFEDPPSFGRLGAEGDRHPFHLEGFQMGDERISGGASDDIVDAVIHQEELDPISGGEERFGELGDGPAVLVFGAGGEEDADGEA